VYLAFCASLQRHELQVGFFGDPVDEIPNLVDSGQVRYGPNKRVESGGGDQCPPIVDGLAKIVRL
jgi:hypothetical protein